MKSSLHVVEEMTSLSRIIRSVQYQQQQHEPKEISLRQMFQREDFADLTFDEPQSDIPTAEEIYAERDVILAQANKEIALQYEQQQQQFEQQQQQFFAEQQSFQESLPAIQQEAYDVGFQQGFEEGALKAQADFAQTLHTANETIIAAQANAQAYVEQQEAVILELALKCAEQIIGTSLEQDEALFVQIVHKALKEAREMKEVKIYVSPQYYELVSKSRAELTEMFPPDVPFLIFVNEDLQMTESYIETNHGRIVVSIDTQLQELRKALSELLYSKE